MKITCTYDEKQWLMRLMAESEDCPLMAKCLPSCIECVQENVQWEIVERSEP